MKQITIAMKNSDAFEEIKVLPSESIDIILTDPPYGINYKSGFNKKSKKLINDYKGITEIYKEFYRILKNNSFCLVFASWKNIDKDKQELEKYFKIVNVIIWKKGNTSMGDLKHSLATNYEVIIVCTKGKPEIRGKREGTIWEYKKLPNNKMHHTTEKPVALLEHCLEKFSDEGDIVLDPFAGSFSTGVACVNKGRNFIGYELDEEYYKVGYNRLEEVKHGNLYDNCSSDS